MTTRTRSKGGFIAAVKQHNESRRYISCSDTAWFDVPNTFASDGLFGDYRTMTDEVTDHFHSRIAKGEVIFNNMRKEQWSVTTRGGETGAWIRAYTLPGCADPTQRTEYQLKGDWFPSRIPSSCYTVTAKGTVIGTSTIHSTSDVDSLKSEVSTKLLAERGRSLTNLWESIAQSRKTAMMIAEPVLKAHQLVRRMKNDIRTGRFSRNWYSNQMDIFGKNIPSFWLQYRYGLLPLIRDVQAIIDAQTTGTGRLRRTTRAKGNLSRLDTTFITGVAYGVTNCTIGLTTSDVVNCRAMSLDEAIIEKMDNLGLATKSLLTTPWELIPYSFVVDWFVNLGDFLNALVEPPGWTALGSCIVTSRQRVTKYAPYNSTCSSGTYWIVRPYSGEVISSYHSVTREPLHKPTLLVKSDFRLQDAVRVADAVALILNALPDSGSKGRIRVR